MYFACILSAISSSCDALMLEHSIVEPFIFASTGSLFALAVSFSLLYTNHAASLSLNVASYILSSPFLL